MEAHMAVFHKLYRTALSSRVHHIAQNRVSVGDGFHTIGQDGGGTRKEGDVFLHSVTVYDRCLPPSYHHTVVNRQQHLSRCRCRSWVERRRCHGHLSCVCYDLHFYERSSYRLSFWFGSSRYVRLVTPIPLVIYDRPIDGFIRPIKRLHQ